MNIFLLFLSFFIFLYVIYLLSYDDFIILRTNTPIEKIFNACFIISFSSLFFARLFYVILNPKPIFLSPLGFILFPYFPGLSLIAAVLGGFAASIFILKLWNLPIGRIMDFLSIAFLASFPFGFIMQNFSSQKHSQFFYFLLVLYSLILFVFIKFILPKARDGKIKDGTLSILFLFSFSSFYLFSNLVFARGKFLFSGENITALLTLLVSFLSFVKKENIVKVILSKRQ